MTNTSPKGSPAGTPPAAPRKPPPRRIGLQVKLVCMLLAIAMVPLVVAAVLIDQTAKVAHNFATNETAFLRPPLEQARGVYLELIATKRDLYYRQVALRLAALPALVALARGPAVPGEENDEENDDGIGQRLDQLLAETPELHGIEIVAPGGAILASRQRARAEAEAEAALQEGRAGWREITVEEPIAGTGAMLGLTFAASMALQEDYLALSQALQRAERIDEVRSALPASYRAAFWLLVGGVIVLVSIAGIVLARRLTVRISALVSGTRRVAAGDLTSRVDLGGSDELAELAWAFNRMIEELEHDREQISYLQRMGAWQEVARKLAHEIKNPLTPIQLAVQQVVSSYRGDDERFRTVLVATEEIVTEEIDGLRRLVDAFRTLGQLPRVEVQPLDVGMVVEDLTRNPALCDHLTLHPPEEPVMVSGDRLLLRRVLANLVENGIHAGMGIGGSGKVVIRWHADADRERAVLTVDDEGPGVTPEMRSKIFEPYVTGKEHGTGLGLAICKKIVLEHRGTLGLAAERAPTGGARFTLSVPLAPADGEHGAAGAEDE